MQVRGSPRTLAVLHLGLIRITPGTMKHFSVICCLLGVVLAVRDKQVNLEDIEKDNLASERRTQQPSKEPQQPVPNQFISPPQPSLQLQQQYFLQPQLLPQLQQQYVVQKQSPVTPPRLQFGFKPMKTQSQQTQKQPLQYAQLPQSFGLASQQFFSYQPLQQRQQHQQQQYITPQRTQQYIQSQSQYQQLDLPYITNNHLPAQDTNTLQQYYTPQFVYLQQYPSASTSIQTVVDPKDGIQYVMYVQPQYLQGAKAEQSQDIETYLQPQDPIYTSQDYNTIQGAAGREQQFQYLDFPQTQVQPEVQIQPQTQKLTNVQYVQQPAVQKTQKFEFTPQKFEAKSLLDSYVPSILQVQYFKQQQQQAQANAIRQTSKAQQPITTKNDFSKNYVPQAAPSQSFNFHYNQHSSSRPTHSQRTKQ